MENHDSRPATAKKFLRPHLNRRSWVVGIPLLPAWYPYYSRKHKIRGSASRKTQEKNVTQSQN
jgi:hypothetical protein